MKQKHIRSLTFHEQIHQLQLIRDLSASHETLEFECQSHNPSQKIFFCEVKIWLSFTDTTTNTSHKFKITLQNQVSYDVEV